MTTTPVATTPSGGHAAAMGAPALDRCPLMPTYGPPALQLVRGEGSWLWDKDGRKYLDLLSGLAVTGLGHSHPAVAQAVHEQAQTLVHVSNLFGTVPGGEVAITLDRLLGGGGQVFFSNSGAEANECALKLARKFGGRGRHVVVSAFGSFHGRTLATLHATGQPAKHEAFQPLPEGFRHVAWNDLDALEAALDPSVAAVLLEPVQGEGGINPASPAYFQGVRPRPVCTSSTMSSTPRSSHSRRTPPKYSAVAALTPPSPCTGSSSTAATLGSSAPASASRSSQATWRNPSGSGW